MSQQILDENEEVWYECRRHWIILLIEVLSLLLMAIIPLIVIFVMISSLSIEIWSRYVPAISFWYSLWLLGIWVILFFIWVDYYLDVWIVTNKRLIDIDQLGLFSRQISTLNLENVQDISVSIRGLIATWLNYGDIEVQTAGSDRLFIMKGIHYPYLMKDKITEAIQEKESCKNKEMARSFAEATQEAKNMV